MPHDPAPLLRRTIYFAGMVQGVGFRYTTRSTATRFKVAGQVRNLGDGRVEVIVEGTREEMDRFQTAVSKAMRRYITDTVSSDAPASGEFTSFSIAV